MLQGPDVLLRRHDGEHRPDGRGARRDRAPDRATRCRRFDIEPRIAMLSFSNFGSNTHANAQKVKTRGRDREGRAARTCRSTARCRPTTPSCPRCWRRSTPGRRVQRRERPDLPGPPVRQHRLQARLAPGRRRGDRADPAGHEAARARAPAGLRRHRHREHGGDRRRGRAGEGRGDRRDGREDGDAAAPPTSGIPSCAAGRGPRPSGRRCRRGSTCWGSGCSCMPRVGLRLGLLHRRAEADDHQHHAGGAGDEPLAARRS